MYPKNAASPPRIAVGPVVQISDGAVQSSGVSIVVRGEGGSESAGGGTTSYGASSSVVYYAPTQAETNYTAFVVTAYKTGCIPVSVTVVTSASGTAGYGGVDWGAVANKTTTNALTGTTIATSQVVASVTGAVGSVTGNVDGNVTGSVGSVTGGLNTTAGVITTLDGLDTAQDTQHGTTQTAIGALNDYDGSDTSGTTTLLARLTSGRAGYLDNLNIGGNVASSAEVTAIQNNTRVVRVVPTVIERPDSGTQDFRIELLLYDSTGNMEAPDSAPTVDLVDQDGTDLTSRLDATTMTLVSVGRYRSTYTAAVADDLEQLIWAFSVVEGGATRLYANTSLIVDTTAVDFTAADRAKLDTLHDTRVPDVISLANIQGEVDTALANYDGPTRAEATADKDEIITQGDSAWATATGFSTHSAADVWTSGTRTLTAATNITAAIADQVWEEAIADHSGTGGSTAEQLAAAGAAGDPWATALPGAYGAGTAGKILGANLDAVLSERTLAAASYFDFTTDGVVLTPVYDAAKTAAQAGDAMALTAGERTTFGTVLEAMMLDEGDASALLAAISAKVEEFLINEGDATATMAAIAAAVRTNLAAELGRIDVAISTRSSHAANDTRDAILDRVLAVNHDTAGTLGKIAQDVVADTNELQTDDVPALIASVLTTQMVESYAGNGVAPTLAQAIFAIHQKLMQRQYSGLTSPVLKLDNSTVAFTGTLDDDTNPTEDRRVP